MEIKKPLLTIAILSFNNCTQVISLIEFLIGCSRVEECEIIVIDDGSIYNQIPVNVLDFCDNIALYTKICNRGVAHSRNMAARIMESEHIIYLDSDIKIDNSLWIDSVLQKIDLDNIYLMGDNKWEIKFKSDHLYWESLSFINGILKLFYDVDFYYEDSERFCFHMINGHGMIVNKKVFFERNIWFDEAYAKSGVEDMDFCLQSYVHGIIPSDGAYISVEFIIKEGKSMANEIKEESSAKAYNNNEQYFAKKWSNLSKIKQFVDKYFKYNSNFIFGARGINFLEEGIENAVVQWDRR